MSPDDIDPSFKLRDYVATGTVDGERICKALNLDAKFVTRLTLSIACDNLIEVQVTRYMTRGEVADLAAELEANPPQLKEEENHA